MGIARAVGRGICHSLHFMHQESGFTKFRNAHLSQFCFVPGSNREEAHSSPPPFPSNNLLYVKLGVEREEMLIRRG